jgi:hypothetical protein
VIGPDPDRCRGDGFLRVFGGICFLIAVAFVATVIWKATA